MILSMLKTLNKVTHIMFKRPINIQIILQAYQLNADDFLPV